MTNLITAVPFIPEIKDALEAEATRKEAVAQKIQVIVDTYKALGWYFVNPVEIANHGYPIIALWPNREGTFTAHMNLAGNEPRISSISLFCERALGTFWFKGRHLTPQAAKVIVEALTGKVFEIETEATEENTEALAPVAEK